MLNSISKPEVIVAGAAAIWGLFWIPLREFERQGLDPGWITISQFIAPLVILLPFALFRILRKKPIGLNQYGTGLLIGTAFALYCESLMLTDVVRALILFYVMPAWGTLVEVGLMGRRFTLFRGLALILSLGGLLVILNLGDSFSLALNTGDVMALLSGIAFTFGAMRIRQSPDIPVFAQLFAFFFYGSLVAVFLAVLPLAELGQAPDLANFLNLVPWILIMAVVFLIPVMWGLYSGSRFVDPGRLGILLQLEAVVGIISAALLAGEPFGWREALGACMVISAGLVEVFGNGKSNLDVTS
jgi:drug/metabolite transporter (DMT)-like permease